MSHLTEKQKAILNDANSVLSWNAIDIRNQWPADIANAFDEAMSGMCRVIDMVDRQERHDKPLKPAKDMIAGAFE